MWELWAECIDCVNLFPLEQAKKSGRKLVCPFCKSDFLSVGIMKRKQFLELTYDPTPKKKRHVRVWKIKEKGKMKARVKKSGGNKK